MRTVEKPAKQGIKLRRRTILWKSREKDDHADSCWSKYL